MDQIVHFIASHWQLVVALLVIVLLIIMNEVLTQKKQGKTISAQEVVDLMNHQNAVVFDIRPLDAYRNGHIINSIHASDTDFEQQRMDKYKQKPIVIVCVKGIRATELSKKLTDNGFKKVYVLSGGITNWQAENLPLIKGK